MGVRMTFECDGCGESTSINVRREFHAFNGAAYGFGYHHVNSDPSAIAPPGWIAYCVVGCTYCPDCAVGLEDR